MDYPIINVDYYRKLLDSIQNQKFYNPWPLTLSTINKINLTFIHKAYQKNNPFDLIISLPRSYKQLVNELSCNLYLYIANKQFYESYYTPEYKLNDRLIEHGKKARQLTITSIHNGMYNLQEIKREHKKDLNGPATYFKSYTQLLKSYYKIQRGIRKQSLKEYINLFCYLNELNETEGLIPTEYNSASVFIGSRTLWDELKTIPLLKSNLWSSIPCYYINREGNKTETLGINPLVYFVPSYHVAYKYIISKKIKVSSIVLLDDGYEDINQILHDQNEYQYKVFGIMTKPINTNSPSLKFWNWHKEEIEIIQHL